MNREPASAGQCVCGQVHDTGVTPATLGRMKAYLALNPAHRFAVDEDEGIVAVIVLHESGPPRLLARSGDLAALLDEIGAPAIADLS